MRTTELEVGSGRRRRTYSAAFKTELVSQCLQLGVSSAAVAISHGMNPNVLRRWIKERGYAHGTERQANRVPASLDTTPAFVALPLTCVAPAPTVSTAAISIEVQRNDITVRVSWPASDVGESAAWVREVLR